MRVTYSFHVTTVAEVLRHLGAVLPVGVLKVETKPTLDPAGVGAAGLPEAWLSELGLAQACR